MNKLFPSLVILVLIFTMLGLQPIHVVEASTPPIVMSPMVIDFEEFRAANLGGLGGLQDINNYYESTFGVTFQGATSLSKADGSLNYGSFPPHSGDAVVYDYQGYVYPGTITITFDYPMKTVGGYFTTNTALTFTAYDALGDQVDQDNSLNQPNAVGLGTGIDPNYYLEVSSTSGIAKVVIQDHGNTYILDDLTLTPLNQYSIKVKPNRSVITVGDSLYFTGTVTFNGAPAANVQIGVDDPMKEQCIGFAATTNANGKFTYVVENQNPAVYNDIVGIFGSLSSWDVLVQKAQ